MSDGIMQEATALAPRGMTGRSSRQARPSVTLVIPALNEARNIGWVLRRIPAGLVDEVVLVDGLSLDDTVAIAKATLADVVIVNERRRGKGNALRAGFAAATCDIIVMLDADGSMDPAELRRFIDAVRDGYDFVKGSRYVSGGGSDDFTWLRRTGNATLRSIVNVLYRTRFTDLCYGFCAFRRSRLDALALTADGFEIETQMVLRALKAGLNIGEVPSYELTRRNGESNLRTFHDGRRVLRTLLRERFVTLRPTPANEVVDLTEPTVIDLTVP